jgi:hypothetical protein
MSASQNGLLTYQLQTNPMPIEVSPEIGDPNVASLTLTTYASGTAFLESLIISFDVGEGAEYLTEVATGILASCSPSNVWQVATENNGDQVAFIVTPIGDSAMGFHGSGPTITIYDIQVASAMGAAVLTITENSSKTDSNFVPHTTELLIAKMPTIFSVSDFATQTPNVSYGHSAVLSWSGSQDGQTTYAIYLNGSWQTVTGDNTWTTPTLYATTTFVLRAETQYLGETRTKYLSVTVTVNNPSLTAHDLTVNSTSMFNNLATFSTTQVNSTAEFDGAVTMNSTLQANSQVTVVLLTVLGNATIDQNVTIGTSSSSADLKVYGTATFYGGAVYINDTTPNTGGTRVALNMSNLNGQMTVYNSSGQVGVQCYIDGNGNGDLYIQDNSGNSRHIHLYVDDADGYSAISLGNAYIRSDGHKNFCLPHPHQPDKDIWYTCIEGPEAAVYARGTARLVNGQATVELPEHFVVVSSDTMTTVTLTPLSAESLGLAVVKKGTQSFTVRELHKGTGNYKFDWEIKAVRAGAEDYEVIRKRRKR